jgi:hypothetical protein
MVAPMILVVLVSIPFGVYRGVGKWGISFLWLLAAAISYFPAQNSLRPEIMIGQPRGVALR